MGEEIKGYATKEEYLAACAVKKEDASVDDE